MARQNRMDELGPEVEVVVDQLAELVGVDGTVELEQPGREHQRLGPPTRHGAVPLLQSRVDRLAHLVGRLDLEQQRQQPAGHSRDLVMLQFSGGQRRLRLRLQPVEDAFGAVGRRPIGGDEVRITVRRDAVVGVDDAAARRVVDLGQMVERQEAVPVGFAVPARGIRSVRRSRQWHPGFGRQNRILN